jgi:5'-3' exonuclease
MKLIIDGNNLICAAYFVTRDMPDKKRVKGTVSLFYTMMEKLRKDFNIKKLYIAWDGKDGANWRKEILPEYKANRTHNKQIRKCINKATKRWDKGNYIHFQKLDAEADDIIYALCRLLKGKIVIVSSDKDFIQVVQEGLAFGVFDNTKKQYRKIPNECAIERASIIGADDNLKGIPGKGPKFADSYFLDKNKAKLSKEEKEIFEKHLKVIGLKNNPYKDELLKWTKEYLYAMEVGF